MTKTQAILNKLKRDKEASKRIQNNVDFAKALATETAINKRGRNA